MKLIYYTDQDGLPNFGDDLNPGFWRRFAPGLVNDDGCCALVGIGTLLNASFLEATLPPSPCPVLVFGAGAGYGKHVPTLGTRWHVYCVRGPLTAARLGLGEELAITDPAILVSKMRDSVGRERAGVGFMPHAINASNGWQSVCSMAGLEYIDARSPVETVLEKIDGVELLITEAMHGAIAADAMRVPWIAAATSDAVNRFKWEDWTQSIGVNYEPQRLPPVWERRGRNSTVSRFRSLTRWRYASHRIRRIANRTRPKMSLDATHESLTARLEERMSAMISEAPSLCSER